MSAKVCTGCGLEKPVDHFSPSRLGKLGRDSKCKPCKREAAKKYRANNPEKTANYRNTNRDKIRAYALANRERERARQKQDWESGKRRDAVLRRNFGITLETYNALWEIQEGKCAICGRAGGKRRLAVDHCHETGNIRGLLCDPCNRGIGFLRESPSALRRAASYIEKPFMLAREV
jgi:hypothetical protein